MVIYFKNPPTEEQRRRVLSIVTGAHIIGPEDVHAAPDIMGKIEISCGHIPDDSWPRASGLRWLQSDWAGMDSLLEIEAARRHPAVITNVHIHAAPISEHLWGMCLMLTRNLHTALRLQDRREWNKGLAAKGLSNLRGKTLCVAGFGAIGRACGAIGRVFGMTVIGIRRSGASGSPAPEADEIVGPDRRREAFSRSRVIMAVLPHTKETERFIGREEMGAMNGAYLLNAGRGSAVDTDALADALRAGNVRGAGLDVTDPEPLPPEHALWSMPNVVITPHYSGIHPGYDEEAFEIFLDNLQRYAAGRPLVNVVDKTRGY